MSDITLLPDDDIDTEPMLDDAAKGRLVVRYVRAYMRQRAAQTIDRIIGWCIPATIMCIIVTPILVFAALLMLADTFGDDGAPRSSPRYAVG